MEYDNKNSGALFKNDKKQSESHPDYKGTINVDGREYWLSSWLKFSKSGNKFMSLSVQPKETQQVQQRQPAQRPAPSHDAARARQLAPKRQNGVFDDMDDDTPF